MPKTSNRRTASRRPASQPARHTRPESHSQSTAAMPNLLEVAKPAIDMSGEFARMLSSIGEEMLEFRTSRLHKVMDTAARLRQARDLSEAIGVQTEFAREMIQDYLSESGKVSDVCMRSLSRGLSASRQAGERAAESISESLPQA
jgi:hypothetical protein